LIWSWIIDTLYKKKIVWGILHWIIIWVLDEIVFYDLFYKLGIVEDKGIILFFVKNSIYFIYESLIYFTCFEILRKVACELEDSSELAFAICIFYCFIIFLIQCYIKRAHELINVEHRSFLEVIERQEFFANPSIKWMGFFKIWSQIVIKFETQIWIFNSYWHILCLVKK
jgi:hypothetical protein